MNKRLPATVAALALTCGACRHSPQDWLAAGNKFAAQGRYQDAELNFRKAIQKDPNFGEACFQLGLLELRQRKNYEAYSSLKSAESLLPERDDVEAQFADVALAIYLSSPRHPATLFDQAAAASDKILARNALSFDGLRIKGMLAAAGRHSAEAEDFYKRANAAKPWQPQLVLAWTEALFDDGKAPEAEALAHQLIARDKTYAPIYGVLVRYYTGARRLAEAEDTLKQHLANDPANADAAIELAGFYAANARESDMNAVLRGMVDRQRIFPDARLRAGDFYTRLRRWDDALSHYQAGAQSTAKTPAGENERVVYLKRIVNVWLLEGKAEQAYGTAAEILRHDPNDEAALTVQGSLLLSTHNPSNVSKAVSLFRTLIVKDSGNASLHYDLGRALAAQGDAEAAKKELRQAIQLQPTYVEPRLTLIELSQASGDYRSVLESADQVLRLKPGMSAIRLVHAVSLLHTGNDGQGQTELNALSREFPGNREVRLQLALADLRNRKYKDAETEFRGLADSAPAGDVRALKGIADTWSAEGETGKAIALLQDDVKKAPGNIPVRSLLASTALAAGNYDLAIEQYRQLTAAAPNSTVFALALSRAFQSKGDSGSAVVWAENAHRLAPHDPGVLIALGDALTVSNRPADALPKYREALRMQPDDAAALSGAASAITVTGGDLDEALTMAQKAVRRDSARPEYADVLGSVYLKRKYDEAAAQVFRGLTGKYPENPLYHYHFALALLDEGARGSARAELKSALQLNPGAAVRSQIEDAMARAGS